MQCFNDRGLYQLNHPVDGLYNMELLSCQASVSPAAFYFIEILVDDKP